MSGPDSKEKCTRLSSTCQEIDVYTREVLTGPFFAEDVGLGLSKSPILISIMTLLDKQVLVEK